MTLSIRIDKLELDADVKALQRELADLSKRQAHLAVGSASLRTARLARTQVDRALRKATGLKVKDTRKRLQVHRIGGSRDTPPGALLWAGMARTRLSRYRYPHVPGDEIDETGDLVTRGEDPFFEATMPNGRRHLFTRGRPSRRYRVRGPRLRADGQSTELPIHKVFVDIQDHISDAMEGVSRAFVLNKYTELLTRELRFRIDRARRRLRRR